MPNTAKTPPAANEKLVDFGSATIPAKDKPARVAGVFRDVAAVYDLMNDVMSLGLHRQWKNTLVGMLAPQPDQHLIDLAGGTGDIAIRFLRAGGGSAIVCDNNPAMIAAGKQKLTREQTHQTLTPKLHWLVGDACQPPLPPASADLVTIGFGLRNITDRQACLTAAYNLLRSGGRFYCLEFSHPPNPVLARGYRAWSRLLPIMGEMVAGNRAAYHYLVESIKRFPDQPTLAAMLGAAGFARVRYRNLVGGIVAIHCGWKY